MQLNPFHRTYRRKLVHAFYASPIVIRIRSRLSKREGVLVYLGLNHGHSFNRIFVKYETCYGFEADPELFAKLQHTYRNYEHVHLFNYAVTDHDGEIEFNIDQEVNDRACSSIGKFSEQAAQENKNLKVQKTITVPCINLCNFLESRGIAEIDYYMSDVQGYDLQVLKTMRAYIAGGRIKSIQCEVSTERGLYADSPDNSEGGFAALLGENYELTARCFYAAPSGIVLRGTFVEIPAERWDYDCRWDLKG